MELCFCYTHNRTIAECSPVSIKCRFSPPQDIWEKRLEEVRAETLRNSEAQIVRSRLEREGAIMTTCAQCGGEQRYAIFHHDEKAKFVYWFCSVECKERWLHFREGTNGQMIRLAGATLLAVLLCFPALAAPPDEELLPYSAWFESVYNKAGGWCCKLADGHITDYRITAEGYVVRIEGQNITVPFNDERIAIRHDKPFIGGVVWWYKNTDGSIAIRCFVADNAT